MLSILELDMDRAAPLPEGWPRVRESGGRGWRARPERQEAAWALDGRNTVNRQETLRRRSFDRERGMGHDGCVHHTITHALAEVHPPCTGS